MDVDGDPTRLSYDIRRIRQQARSTMQEVPVTQYDREDVDNPDVRISDVGGTNLDKNGIFGCSVPHCTARYMNQHGLDLHEAGDKCRFPKNQVTTQQQTNRYFFNKFGISKDLEPAVKTNMRYFRGCLETIQLVELPDGIPMKAQVGGDPTKKQGFAISFRKAAFSYLEKHRKFAKELFDYGNTTQGSNVTPEVAAQKLKDKKNESGEPFFHFTEWLEPVQFKYLFATFQAKLKKGELSNRRRLVEVDPSPEEIMDAIQDQEAVGARQAEDLMIQQTRAIGGEPNESLDHPITVMLNTQCT